MSVPRFPAVTWAYPQTELAQLLYAAVGRDEKISLKLFKQWLSENDFEAVDHRLTRILIAIIARHGNKLRDAPEYTRLVGIQRLMWSRARMAHAHNMQGVDSLAKNDVKFSFIKGGAVTWLPYRSSRERMSHDLDLVVQPDDFMKALVILSEHGWTPSSGQSSKRIRAIAGSLRAVNLFNNKFGDIDLHRKPFHFGQGDAEDDREFWNCLRSIDHKEQRINIPSVEDMLIVAIAHGGYDGHTHSDWMIDCAKIVENENIDWDILLKRIVNRNIVLPSYVTFSYLSNMLGLAIDTWFLQQLKQETGKLNFLSYLVAIVQIRPRQNYSKIGHLFRYLAKLYRKKQSRSLLPQVINGCRLSAKYLWKSPSTLGSKYTKIAALDIPKASLKSVINIELEIEPNQVARRVEFEVNGQFHHIAFARLRLFRKHIKPFRILLNGEIDADESDGPFYIEARASRHDRSNADKSDEMRYKPLKFKLVGVDFS